MAKKSVLVMEPWTPPPVTREEALAPEYSDDGDRALDQMVNVTAPGTDEWERYRLDRERQKSDLIDQEQDRNRHFEIDISNKTGR